MLITIIAGGSGSREIQRGIMQVLGHSASYRVLINCYDIGRSTRLTRQLYSVLGPADLKKNQVFKHSLLSNQSTVPDLLNHRFAAYSLSEIVEQIDNLTLDLKKVFSDSYHEFFDRLRESFVLRMELHRIESVEDFNYTDIIYGYLANQLGDLTQAAHVMAQMLEIPKDSVLINSHDNLYLHAETEHGRIIADEADIVFWNNPHEIISNVFLVNADGVRCTPSLNPEVETALIKSNIVIISCGTQWSSLIPTYLTEGFDELLKTLTVPIYLIINNTQDTDMIGINSVQLINTVGKFLSLPEYNRLVLVYNEHAVASMRIVHSDFDTVIGKMSDKPGIRLHNGRKLIRAILQHYKEQ